MYQDIVTSFSKGNEVDVIYLDFTKAFDKVCHTILIDRLKTYGIGGKLIGWFNSYLTGRQQRVVLDGIYSNWLDVTSGVPQGSILGPLLFLVYIDEMPNYLRNDSKLYIALFADDSKLYSRISNATDSERLQNDLILLLVLIKIQKWNSTSQNVKS